MDILMYVVDLAQRNVVDPGDHVASALALLPGRERRVIPWFEDVAEILAHAE